MEEEIERMIHFKLGSKQFQKEAKRCEKQQHKETLKIKEALEQGDVERARIHSWSAIHEKNKAFNHLRISSRLDEVCSQVQRAIKLKKVTESMYSAYRELAGALKDMNIEKVSTLVEECEKQFGIAQTHADVPTDTQINQQVDALILQVAEENGLELIGQLSELQPGRSEPIA